MHNGIAVKIAGVIMVVAGIGMMVAAIYFLVYNTWFWITAESTEGEVVGWEHMEAHRLETKKIWEKRARSSLVLFKDGAGKETFLSTDVGSENELYTKGEKVTVLYKPQEPENAKIKDFKSMYLGPVLLLPFGVVFWFVGVLVKALGESCGSRK